MENMLIGYIFIMMLSKGCFFNNCFDAFRRNISDRLRKMYSTWEQTGTISLILINNAIVFYN